jgi:AraC-like DNA-binding protein
VSSKQPTSTDKVKATPVNYPSFVFRSVCKSPTDIASVLAGTGLTSETFERPGFRLELPIMRRFLSNVIQHTQDPHIWLRLAPNYKTEYIGLPAHAAMNAPRLVDGLEIFNRFEQLAFPLIGYSFDRTHAGRATSECEICYRHKFPDDLTYCLLGCSLIVALNVLDEMLKIRGVATRVEFSVPKPDGWDALAADIGLVPFHFGAAQSKIVFPTDMLERPLPGADPINHQRYVAMCEKLAAEPAPSESPVDRVLGYLKKTEDNDAQLSSAAFALGYSERTLRRHLENAGTSFRRLKEQARLKRAEELLRNTSLSIHVISHELGYETPSNFARSFKRWTGKTPKAFREEQLAVSAGGRK